MHLHRLQLTNFKNYEHNDLEFSPGINCFVGNNGVGKTNILDAIHFLSLAKSFFSQTEGQNIRHGEDFFIVNGVISHESGDDTVICSFIRNRQKSLKRNGKEYERLSDHIGKYPAVMVSPADSSLVTEGSEERRKFLNKIISQYNSEYLDALLNYNRALISRNKLLKDYYGSGRFDEEMISSYDLLLEKYGSIIHRERSSLVEKLIPLFQDYYDIISMKRERVELVYRSQLNNAPLGQLLEGSRERDRYLQYTTAGIHKDDLEFIMGGHPVRQLGSQGQQKSYLVSLKLAKFGYIAEMTGITPLLLLDDLFDKFDSDRVEQLIRLLGSHRFGQIFITDTNQERLHKILEGSTTDFKLFRIGSGGVEEIIQNGSTK
ncbi:MAG: DNA replication and repair protein RecF [Bacteroidales bacterium]|nr:DNA replication and repair protein RecF [Bacteroidales bacterium]